MWDLEVLTTCAEDYLTWANTLPEGLETIAGVPVRRFQVDQEEGSRGVCAADGRHSRSCGDALSRRTAQMDESSGPDSSDLLAFLRRNAREYALVVFFSYLYGTTYFGMQEVPSRAVLSRRSTTSRRSRSPCIKMFSARAAISCSPHWRRSDWSREDLGSARPLPSAEESGSIPVRYRRSRAPGRGPICSTSGASITSKAVDNSFRTSRHLRRRSRRSTSFW